MSAAEKPIILVDGSSYLYRAFHALPPLTTSSGQPTGAVRGVTSMLRKLIKDYDPQYMAVIFDAKGKTFRDELFEEYKSNRPPMPDDLRAQVQPLHDLIRAMGLPLIIEDGVEADDVIGTFARIFHQQGKPVLISTGDKDMAQLVTDKVTLINTMNNALYDIEGVKQKFGVGPELIIDFLALMGDKVDNIPGVPGVGEKTALGLIQGLGSLEDIYANLDKVAELSFRGAKTMAKKLEEHKEMAFLSYQLATIKLDCELSEDLNDLKLGEPDNESLARYYQELEFKGWLSEVLAGADASVVAAAEEAGDGNDAPRSGISRDAYDIVYSEAMLEKWLTKLKDAGEFAFDTETTSLNYMNAELVGFAVAVSDKAAYIPFGHNYPGAPDQLDKQLVMDKFKPLLEDDTLRKIGQNLKYDMSVLAEDAGITLRGVAYDTMLESYVLDSVATRHDMDSLSLKYLGRKTISFEEIAGKGAKQLTFNQVGLHEASRYAAEDADVTLRLHQTLWPKLEQEGRLTEVFRDIELPLVTVLSRIERNGTYVDATLLKHQSQFLAKRMAELQEKAFEIAGQEFNLASPKQLGEILYEKLEIPVIKKTPKGAPSTAEPVLQELALEYPLPQVIMDYRGVAKLKNTYTDKLPELINQRTGRVHTSYHQAVAATGRLSSSDPNLQNIPVRSEEGRKIRQAFLAPKGRKIVACDYSQIELRIMAHLSGDKGLTDAFEKGLDIHRATAAEVWGKSLEEVSDNDRRNAKAINFGLIYGMSAFGLAKQLGLPRKEAQDYIDLYFERYPGVKRYMEETRAQASEQGYVETLFGRRLYLPEIRSSNGQRRQAAERTAINAPMQGTAADIIKKAMIKVHDWLDTTHFDAKMIMQVHDELVFEVAENQVDDLVKEVKARMESAAELKVPLIVDAGVGENWEEAH
ncbi:MAG: DNA polymerase I [Alcanivorax sp.]|jgi:DNA polymerase-1|uniref:DNA polymerase I n=2 Tax=Alcanivoracaceae TaxID=224372 RepID=UPI002354F9EF|nr:DNA polymerase I [Alcanivorax jadensis]|tara:strand:- start:1248 stop:4007 length:2760 start_codon:yes stop_codon:yes gene_type:complete